MSKYIRWKNGQMFTEELLTTNDELQHENLIKSICNIQKYYYGIGNIKINEMNLIHGILSIESCSITFTNGNTVSNFSNINEFQFQKVFQGQDLDIFLRYTQNNSDLKYITDEVIIDTQGDIYLGKIQNIHGVYQISVDGCYLDLQEHNTFLKFITNAINELTTIYTYYQNELINIDSNEYFKQLTQSIIIKQIIQIFTCIYDSIHHPFDAYKMLCPYMYKYIKYDHQNNIKCLRMIIENILQSHKIIDENNIVEMDDQYYYINMRNKIEANILINPRDDLVVSWAENTYICSKDKMKSLERQIHKGMNRQINRYKQYLMLTIYRDNNYMDDSNIVCIAKDNNLRIINIKMIN